jgi:hypothetical protein
MTLGAVLGTVAVHAILANVPFMYGRVLALIFNNVIIVVTDPAFHVAVVVAAAAVPVLGLLGDRMMVVMAVHAGGVNAVRRSVGPVIEDYRSALGEEEDAVRLAQFF